MSWPALRLIADRLRQLVAIAHLKVIDDTGPQQVAQLQIMAGGPDGIEEVIDKTPRVGEYGLASCPPAGAEAVVLFLGGYRSQGVIVATGDRATRLKGLQPGESALYNGVTGKWLKQAADGVLHGNGDVTFDGTVNAAHVIPADGATGTFTSQDGKTITVTHGVITRIV